MKRTLLLIVVLLSSSVLFNSCKKEEVNTTLSITVSKNPEGGNGVSTLSAEITGTISGPTKDIEATIEWWWENEDHEKAAIQESETVTFNSENATKKSSVYKAATGYVLLNYYWIKVTWSDDDGPHTLESSKAYCSYSK